MNDSGPSDGQTISPTVPPETEVRLRLIGAGLIIAALIIALIALVNILTALSAQDTEKDLVANGKLDAATKALIAAHLQNVATAATGLFGALTTFLGTAIGAYFGIAAASSSNKAANTAVLQHAQMAQQLASQTQDDNAQLRKQLVNIATAQSASGGDGSGGDGSAGKPSGASGTADGGDFGPVLDPKDETGPGHASAVTTPPANVGLAADVLGAGSEQ